MSIKLGSEPEGYSDWTGIRNGFLIIFNVLIGKQMKKISSKIIDVTDVTLRNSPKLAFLPINLLFYFSSETEHFQK